MSEVTPKKRGPKPGQKRGTYAKKNSSAKNRVFGAYEESEDWGQVAKLNGVKLNTAKNWIRNEGAKRKPRGGKRLVKVEEWHVERLLSWIEENPRLTLKQMKERLEEEEGLVVGTSTIDRHLQGRMTMKRIRVEPETMNSTVNKEKRRDYVERVMEFLGDTAWSVVWTDESNVNLHISRTEGRAAPGQRCVVKGASAKGANVHIIAGISQLGIVHHEIRRGHFRVEESS